MAKRAAWLAASTFLLLSGAAAEERNVLAPYRFRTPAAELGAVERDRALLYRNQLQRQRLDLDRAEALDRIEPLDRHRRLETQTELGRMNGIVGAPQPLPPPVPGARPLPSLASPTIAPRSF
jgi:hypothetical protein